MNAADGAAVAPVIVWFTSDLRLSDHPALSAALRTGRPVVACFIVDPQLRNIAPGGASRWWLHYSLQSLNDGLAVFGNRLVLRRGSAAEVLEELVRHTGAARVYVSESLDAQSATVQRGVSLRLSGIGAELIVERGNLLFDPNAIRTGTGSVFRVFTPFWRACLAAEPPGDPLPAPRAIPSFAGAVHTERLEDWRLLPKGPDWARGLAASWSPGEIGAHTRLEEFVADGLADYSDARDRPDRAGCSRLSPHLHFGELSPGQVWHAVRLKLIAGVGLVRGGEAFLRELGWREFSQRLALHATDLCKSPLRKEFDDFPWRSDPENLTAWQRGRTGFPIVDAGMRQLWHTGWMHNRVRMIAASFLVKDLLISWRAGAEWFFDTLVDADIGNNCASWQWVAGCGADAAPFFRVFNPTLQARKFDPDGSYVRRWLPELAALPSRYIHDPVQAPETVLKDAGIELGRDYPLPTVDHAAARRRALAAFSKIKSRG